MACVSDEHSASNFTPNGTYNHTGPPQWITDAEHVLDNYVIHYTCLFGIIGNLINLVVLTRKSLTAHMERMEKSSHIGLIALAVSDFLYCVCAFPNAWVGDAHFMNSAIDFKMVYYAYGTACINCFLLISSWLTVAMAVCRYVAICHPLKARQYLGMTATRIIICVVFCVSIVFNLPQFWIDKISTGCHNGSIVYFVEPGYMKDDAASIPYRSVYFVLGILFPLVVLAYCNIFLVNALRVSSHLRSQHASKSSSSDATRIVTLTLCVIVIMYIVLVSPAEMLAFWRPYIGVHNMYHYGLAVTICNALQTFNFAVNFILYCIINVHFRKVMTELLLCYHIREQIQPVVAASKRNIKPAAEDKKTEEEAIAML